MDESSVQRHCDAMMEAEVIAVDVESTGLLVKDGRDFAIGISVAYRFGPLGIVSGYFPFRHPDSNLPMHCLDALRTVLSNKPLVFHHLKNDLHMLKTLGINPTGRVFCTMMIAHMINEELLSKELDVLSAKYLNDRKTDEVKRWADVFGWDTVPVGLMDPYARHDTELTLRLFEHPLIGWPQLKEQELASLWAGESEFTRTLFRMEQRGVRINPEFTLEKRNAGNARMASIEGELGWKPSSPTDLGNFLLNELGLPVVKRTPKDKPCFDKEAMSKYDAMLERVDRKEAQLVAEYRGWQKATTSLYDPLLKLVSPDGRIRPNFKQHGTKTGRLSCQGPNLQQIPRKSDKAWNGDAKKCFSSDDGWSLWGYDYSQLEFRLAAAYGSERWLLDEFAKDDADPFTVLAKQIGETRQTTKTFVYANTYGAGLAKIAQTLGRSEADVKPAFDRFKESISGIRHASNIATERAKANGYVRYWNGRRRHFQTEGYHKAFNSLLQGGGAAVVAQAMVEIDNAVCDDNYCRMVLQVHDEIVFEIKDGYKDKVEPDIIHIMTNFPQFGVRFAVEGKVWNG